MKPSLSLPLAYRIWIQNKQLCSSLFSIDIRFKGSLKQPPRYGASFLSLRPRPRWDEGHVSQNEEKTMHDYESETLWEDSLNQSQTLRG